MKRYIVIISGEVRESFDSLDEAQDCVIALCINDASCSNIIIWDQLTESEVD